MVVHVDEAGRDDQPRRIDTARSRRRPEITDSGDAPVSDPDVRPHGTGAFAVAYGPCAAGRAQAEPSKAMTTKWIVDAARMTA
jgi:hypothetical protein